jgi:hypothetical protein
MRTTKFVAEKGREIGDASDTQAILEMKLSMRARLKKFE